jgi:hypothetical protein
MKLKLPVCLSSARVLLALSLLCAAAPAAAQSATPEAPTVAPAEPVTLTVTGVITNATSGAANPAGALEVKVHTFDPNDNMGNVTTLTTTLGADGKFIFPKVTSQVGWELATATEYQGVIYSSRLTTVAAGQSTVDLPVAVYETTAEMSGVIVEQMHMFFDFSADTLSVVELFIISNTGDRAVVNPAGTVEFALPAGATDLQVQGEIEGMDYARTAQGFIEKRAIAPGSGTGQILASFSLPYPGQLSFEQKMLYPVAAADVLVPENGVKLTSSVLQDKGLRNMGSTPYRIHGITDMKAGQTLSFQLSGTPSRNATSAETGALAPAPASVQAGPDPRMIGVGVGVLGLVVVVIGVWFYRRQAQAPGTPSEGRSRDELIQAIADLDDAFEAGNVEEPVYQRRRAKLKAQLVEMMESEK